MEQNNEVVVDRAKSQWSDLWKKEDYWAIWIGFFFLIVAAWLCFGQRPALEAKFNEYETIIKAEESKPFKTIEWYKATAAQKNVQAQKQSQVADVIAYLKTPARWTDNPLDALMMDQARADERNAALKPKVEAAKQAAAEALATAKVAQDAAAAAGYQDAGLNDAARPPSTPGRAPRRRPPRLLPVWPSPSTASPPSSCWAWCWAPCAPSVPCSWA